MKALLAIVVTLLLVAYPVLVYVSVQQQLGPTFAFLILALLLVRAAMVPRAGRAIPLVGAGLVGLYLLTRDERVLLWYPVLVNGLMLLAFGWSLRRSPSMIEQFARLRHPNLPAQAVPYLRRVTVAWCVFFVVNGSIATATVIYGDMECWTLYNGLISYGLMGLMVVAELLIRPKYQEAA
ncbi:Uncharacterized membrane protein [Ferrimonas sediminum]|uniref:Uncharacterized membrane protein n=1 Tax=Ferrimonas sediminum TaxID=718193 RepID=A0A1G8N9K6_9GAMM|nr:hypothetical protein [Ferrimonas sediminum]SDI76872.1 Uncharacterized membrane protein [Ferrimonas sediminum]